MQGFGDNLFCFGDFLRADRLADPGDSPREYSPGPSYIHVLKPGTGRKTSFAKHDPVLTTNAADPAPPVAEQALPPYRRPTYHCNSVLNGNAAGSASAGPEWWAKTGTTRGRSMLVDSPFGLGWRVADGGLCPALGPPDKAGVRDR